MGTSYEYKCNECGFEHQYFVGGGFFTEEYFRETDRLKKELKADALAGKYGDVVKAVIEADTDNLLCFSCGTELFQCSKCCKIFILRQKKISTYCFSDTNYDLNIEIKQNCPNCGSKYFDRIAGQKPKCPECKKSYMDLVSIGKWD